MNAFAAPNTSTPEQRDYIRRLLDATELSTDRFTYQHRIPWKDARLPEPPFNGDIDAHLRTLSKAQASALIRVLKLRADEADEEEND